MRTTQQILDEMSKMKKVIEQDANASQYQEWIKLSTEFREALRLEVKLEIQKPR